MRKRRSILFTGFICIILLSVFLKNSPPSPLYYLKVSREFLQSFFIFGSEDKANWYLTLAEKRISEAEQLKSKRLNFIAQKQIKIASEYQKEAEKLLLYLQDKTNINYLLDKFNQNRIRLEDL